MTKTEATYVDRDQASEILKVSTRTLDRYIRKYKFKTRKDGRRVLIKRVDVDRIIQDQIGQFVDLKNENLQDAEQAKSTSLAVKNIKVESVRNEEDKQKEKDEEKVYKNLYTEAKKELKEKQERLDAATYRVGQLESQVKSMVPMLEFNRKEKELKEARHTIEQKEVEKVEVVHRLERLLKNERIAKWTYLAFAGLLLAVWPVLFLIWGFA